MTVSVGLVGAGGIGETHAGILQNAKGATLAGVCDVDATKARELAERVNAAAYTDHRDLFVEEPLDAVYLTTPPTARVEIVREAADRGVAIFCEKPLATTAADGRAIVDIVEQREIPFMMGFCLRFCEPCLRLKDLVVEGRLGEPISLFSMRGGQGVPEDGNWRVDPDQACGITIESASHNVDLLRWLGGEIASAAGATTNVTHPELDDFDDNVVATATFENGAIGCVQNSWTSSVEYLRHGVIGAGGAAVLEGDGWWRLDRLRSLTDAGRHPTTVEFDPATATEMGYRGETEAFLDAVAAGEDPPVGVRDGLRALEVAHEILE